MRSRRTTQEITLSNIIPGDLIGVYSQWNRSIEPYVYQRQTRFTITVIPINEFSLGYSDFPFGYTFKTDYGSKLVPLDIKMLPNKESQDLYLQIRDKFFPDWIRQDAHRSANLME